MQYTRKEVGLVCEFPRREQVLLYRKPIMVNTKRMVVYGYRGRWDCTYLLIRSESTVSGTGVSETGIKGAAVEVVTEDSKEDADAGTAVNPQTDTESGVISVGSDAEAISVDSNVGVISLDSNG